ncbi:hypothetical protein IMG5_026300 [Ichthyophthirius multifiliis]|uniref:Uncharacterized protein n=1 Tax=Ichthyophthirius multifiliis TaxID=5932 RepID=G0QL66_ICHMU|nr:hypothetical protein IMG5_026300 [Ichthyophthirius multifiliis]EGR34039.1 hypothetical protein IMG5_026300 [Ichthyophthirius multifiliis]|eukprot:XP_004039343.1 hypothetical protein IMG5_026300 [Ichthyophthirius multifiliis]
MLYFLSIVKFQMHVNLLLSNFQIKIHNKDQEVKTDLMKLLKKIGLIKLIFKIFLKQIQMHYIFLIKSLKLKLLMSTRQFFYIIFYIF